MAFNENPTLYQEFRKLSAIHFNQYLHDVREKYHIIGLNELTWSEDEIKIYSELLEHAGNPIYLQELLEHFPYEPTNGFKIALWSVLTISHCLDLARCYNTSKYDKATTKKLIL